MIPEFLETLQRKLSQSWVRAQALASPQDSRLNVLGRTLIARGGESVTLQLVRTAAEHSPQKIAEIEDSETRSALSDIRSRMKQQGVSANHPAILQDVHAWVRSKTSYQDERPAEDEQLYNGDFVRKKNYLQPLQQTLDRKAGVCRDLAFARYVCLKLLGMPEEKMNLLYIDDKEDKYPHVVVIVRADDKQEYLLCHNLDVIMKKDDYFEFVKKEHGFAWVPWQAFNERNRLTPI